MSWHCGFEDVLKAAPHGNSSGAGIIEILQGSACSTTALRAVTLLFGVACLPLFYALHRRLHPRAATAGNSLATVSVPRQSSLHCSPVRLSGG